MEISNHLCEIHVQIYLTGSVSEDIWPNCSNSPEKSKWQVDTSELQVITTNKRKQFFTGRMPFLSPNQQCQSTEGKTGRYMMLKKFKMCLMSTCVRNIQINVLFIPSVLWHLVGWQEGHPAYKNCTPAIRVCSSLETIGWPALPEVTSGKQADWTKSKVCA